jgi:hypothetical protein
MARLTRRGAIQALGITITDAALPRSRADAQATRSTLPWARQYAGADLAGWEVLLGDASHIGQPPTELADIVTLHLGDQSEVRANVRARPQIMAHNITFHKYIDERAFDFVHRCSYEFRLPYLPSTSNTTQNGQTVEGSLQLWDGIVRQRLHSVAFQWVINPFATNVEAVQCWTSRGWQPVWSLPLDTEWHTIRMVLDARHETSGMQLDGINIPSCYTIESKSGFGTDISAALAAEAISIDPGVLFTGGKPHTVQFRNWLWDWEPAAIYQAGLPLVASDL